MSYTIEVLRYQILADTDTSKKADTDTFIMIPGQLTPDKIKNKRNIKKNLLLLEMVNNQHVFTFH